MHIKCTSQYNVIDIVMPLNNYYSAKLLMSFHKAYSKIVTILDSSSLDDQ